MRDRSLCKLSRWTKDFLDPDKKLLYHEVVTRFFPDGDTTQTKPNPVHSVAEAPLTVDEPSRSPLGDTVPTRRYIYKDGREYVEFVQVVIDSGSDLTFLLGLMIDGKWIIDSMWSLLEIRAHGGEILYKCTR